MDIVQRFIDDINNSPDLSFIKIYNEFQFKLISFPIKQPIMAVCLNNISSVKEFKNYPTTSNIITLKVYSPEKSCNMHISDISRKICSALENLGYPFDYNGYSHNPIGYFESSIIVNLPLSDFLLKDNISVSINNIELPFVKDISVKSQRQEHCIFSLYQNNPIRNITFNEHYTITVDFFKMSDEVQSNYQNNHNIDKISNFKDFTLIINNNNNKQIFKNCNWLEITDYSDNKNRLIIKLIISTYNKE